MTRKEFYSNDVCCEVARVYTSRFKLSAAKTKRHKATQHCWTGVDPDMDRARCDAMIDEMFDGDVQSAYAAAMEYLVGGCGIRG